MARLAVVWCPDWPVVAAARDAGIAPTRPAAVLAANRVVACSALARAAGVRRGMPGRQAQGCCPELVALADDPLRSARLFEPVAAAVEELAVGVEIVRPGVVAVPARGPAGYFGGEQAAAERLIDQVATATGVECQVGVADGLFAALLAARHGQVVPAGRSAEFLAPHSVRELHRPAEGQDRAELVDLLRRLGLRTLGAFAALPESDVASRFGAGAVLAHHLAGGRQRRPPVRRRPPPELAVTELLDPPVERVDATAFVARNLAERLHAGLAAHGLACTRLRIRLGIQLGTTPANREPGSDTEYVRVWRCAEPLTPDGVADRMRWQLDGWLSGKDRPRGGVCLVRLEPAEVIEGHALQLDLLRDGEHAEVTERAGRAMVHVQGLLGENGVVTAVLGGGRGPRDRVRLVAWGNDRTPDGGSAGTRRGRPPWPGRLPAPSPATVPAVPLPAAVLDATGAPVRVTDRFVLTAPPAEVTVSGRGRRANQGGRRRVDTWAGPWPADERWWTTGNDSASTPGQARRRAWLQVIPERSDPLLLVWEHQRWTVEGIYD